MLNRRKFVKNCTALSVAAGFGAIITGCNTPAAPARGPRKEYPLLAPLTKEQEEAIKDSYLANQDIEGWVDKGYGCGDVLIQAYMEKHNLSNDLLDATIAFKNGFACRDICCLYSTAMMIFSLSVSDYANDRESCYLYCEQKIKKFRNWWLSKSPLNCEDIYPLCKEGYENQYKRVAYVVEKIADNPIK